MSQEDTKPSSTTSCSKQKMLKSQLSEQSMSNSVKLLTPFKLSMSKSEVVPNLWRAQLLLLLLLLLPGDGAGMCPARYMNTIKYQ